MTYSSEFARVAGALALIALIGCADENAATDAEKEALEQGWESFIAGLEAAREEVEDPWIRGPSPSGRDLAEGHRYLLGHVLRITEATLGQHTDSPYFQRYIHMMSKFTIDNPDTMYLMAPIDPDGTYLVSAHAADTTEWRTGERDRPYPKAPRLVTFQTVTATIGDTGELSEFATCRNQTFGFVQHFGIEPDADGRFEILVAAEKPPDYRGHFLATKGNLECKPRDGEPFRRDRVASHVAVRESFADWDREVPLELEIVRTDAPGSPKPPTDALALGEQLANIGTRVANQVRFWNSFHELALEVHGDRNFDFSRNLPENAMNDPSPPFVAGGTAGSRQLYASGVFELEPRDALVVRVATPREPHYMGFQLGNFWGESLDQASYTSSRTASQLEPASDGARYYVVSLEDPGVPGWLDPTGLRSGQMSMRFVYRTEVEQISLPTITTRLTTLDELHEHLPGDTPKVSTDERRQEVARRQAHIRRRWRQY